MDTNEQRVARLKELMRIAKANRLAMNQSEFSELIGISKRTLEGFMQGRPVSLEYIVKAETLLKEKGISLKEPKLAVDEIEGLKKRVERLERAVFREIKDETL